MTERTTYDGDSTQVQWPDDGSTEGFGNQYARHLKTLFDAAVLPLTGVGGTADVVTASLDPVLDAEGLKERMKFTIVWADANTGPVTLAINGGSALAVRTSAGDALEAGMLGAGLVSVIERVGGQFRILSPLMTSAGGGASRYYWQFTASGTWNKPTGLDPDTLVTVEAWGAGGGGGRGSTGGAGGGGGGGYALGRFRLGDLPSSVAVAIGAGGEGRTGSNGAGTVGGNTTFGALLTAYGGGPGTGTTSGNMAQGGSGGGELGAGNNSPLGGKIGGGGSSADNNNTRAWDATSIFGGGAGSNGITVAGDPQGGAAVFGGAGGGASKSSSSSSGGVSRYGGNGGDGGRSSPAAQPGTAPGGGGGGGGNSNNGAVGARGEVRVWV